MNITTMVFDNAFMHMTVVDLLIQVYTHVTPQSGNCTYTNTHTHTHTQTTNTIRRNAL
jgi:hypothetical protein